MLVCDELDESDDDDVFFLNVDVDGDDADDGDADDDDGDTDDEFPSLDLEPFCCFFFGRYL